MASSDIEVMDLATSIHWECCTTVNGAPSCSPSPCGRIRKSRCPFSASLAHIKANLCCCSSQRGDIPLLCWDAARQQAHTSLWTTPQTSFLSCKANLLTVLCAWWRRFTRFLMMANNHCVPPFTFSSASQDSEGCNG